MHAKAIAPAPKIHIGFCRERGYLLQSLLVHNFLPFHSLAGSIGFGGHAQRLKTKAVPTHDTLAWLGPPHGASAHSLSDA